MSRENTRKYPRSVESKNSFLRIRAPENLDIALEGLIRKVLKEQPKMDDIYAFAADYFDMLLKIREKAGIKKLSAQDICPYHNEDDAHEMVKLASSFTKRTKPHSNTYKAVTLRNQDQSKYRKTSEKLTSKDLEDKTKEDEGSDRFENKLSVVKENTEIEKAKAESVESESIENETAYSIKVSGQEVGEEIFIRANEVVTEYSAEDEDSPRELLGNGPETVGDINELRDKIRAVENEIKRLDSKENKSENDIADGDVAGEDINETGKVDENCEENKLQRNVEDIKEEGTGPAAETEAEENLQPQEDQEVKHNTLEQSKDNDVNTENLDALDEKLEEQEGVNKSTENEESPKTDVEIDVKDAESATTDVNTEAAQNVEETKLNPEAIDEVTRSEAEEVKSAGDDAQKVEETSLEEQTENKGTEEENLTGMTVQDEALQEKENEMVGEENLNSENKKSEVLAEGEGEATEVLDSEVTDAEVPKGEDGNSENENLGVFKASDKTPEESPKPEEEEKIDKQSVDDAGPDISVTDSAAPVLIASALNGMEKVVEEAPAEELPAAEKKLFTRDPEISIATEIQNFLDMEREYSSNEKESMAGGNSVESRIVSRTVSELGTIKENEELVIPRDDTPGKVPEITQDPDDPEPDNQEGSTTSDEIEFETSPAKYPETDNDITTAITNTQDDEIQKETGAETEIVLELNTDDQEIEAQAEEHEKKANKVFLEVPELKLDENMVRKSERESVDTMRVAEEPEDKEVPICGNVGNEMIQKGEVEKVELVEGEEDILQVHLTTTVESHEHDPRDSVHVEMTSRIDPNFTVSVETKIESPVQEGGNLEKMQLIRAAVIIQNGFRRFKNKKISGERKQDDKQRNNENESISAIRTVTADSHGDGNPSAGEDHERTLNLIRTRTLVESQSLDSVRKISPLKTRSLSSVRHGAGDFEVWNQLVKELEEAATKIQSNYRGYKSRKKLQRENAIQSTTTSEGSTSIPDPEINHRHTGEFHDSLVLPLDPK